LEKRYFPTFEETCGQRNLARLRMMPSPDRDDVPIDRLAEALVDFRGQLRLPQQP